MAEINSKRFPEWIKVKAALDRTGRLTGFSNGQVWWAAIGENVGVEINGKSETFGRPVLIYKKLSEFGFLGIPLTSQKRGGSWYVSFEFQGRTSYAALSQIRVLSVFRLYRSPIGKVSRADFEKVCRGFDNLYHFSDLDCFDFEEDA